MGRLLSSPALSACHAPDLATCYISDKISDVFFSPHFPLPSPSQRSWKYTSVLQSFSPYQVTGDRARESKTVRKKGKARNTVGRKRGDSSLRGNTYHIKARITQVWHKHCFLCYQSTEAEQNQPICAYTARQPPNCLSTAQRNPQITQPVYIFVCCPLPTVSCHYNLYLIFFFFTISKVCEHYSSM